MVIASTFLLIVFKNLPYPLNAHFFWISIWTLALIIFKPKILMSKQLFYFYLYAIIYLVMFSTLWNDYEYINKSRIYEELVDIFAGLTLIKYYISTKDFIGLRIVIRSTILIITVTCITSLIGLFIYPTASREIGGIFQEEEKFELITFYQKIGIAGYSFYTILIFLIPILIGQFKLIKFTEIDKVILLTTIILLYLTIFKARIFANILNALIVGIIALNVKKDLKSSINIAIAILVLLFLIPNDFYIFFLKGVHPYFAGTETGSKIIDIINTISINGDQGTGMENRAARIPELWGSFSIDPIFGGGIENAHLHWLNKLSLFGLVGVIPYFLILINQVKSNFKIFDTKFRFLYMIAIVSFIFQGSLKSLLGSGVLLCIYFIIPGLYFLNYTQPKKKYKDHDPSNANFMKYVSEQRD
jgi:hypothetical protein